jgi:hypothetical protein
MGLFARRCLYRARGLESLIEEWEITRNHATFAADLEQLARECLEVAAVANNAWLELREMLRTDANSMETESAGQFVKRGMQVLENAIVRLGLSYTIASKRGLVIASWSDMDSVSRSVHTLVSNLNGVFPEYDAKAMEEATTAFLRGECISSEELIREAQGYSPARH